MGKTKKASSTKSPLSRPGRPKSKTASVGKKGMKFTPAKTGRVVKLSPAKTRLGLSRIRTAVKKTVNKPN